MLSMKAKDLIIYSDMDGTMLTDWSRGPNMPPKNLAAIRGFIEKGGTLSVASGRQYTETLRYFGDVMPNAPLVMGNGSVVYDTLKKKVVQKTQLPQAFKEEVLKFFLEGDDFWIVAADEFGIYQVESGDAKRDDALRDLNRKRISADEFLKLAAVKVVYILDDPIKMPRFERETAELHRESEVASALSAPIYLEYFHCSVSKANGIRFALNYAGLRDKTLVCIGDYYNDSEMLKLADIAACPENAAPGIHELCSIHTCGNNEGAVGELIERLYKM